MQTDEYIHEHCQYLIDQFFSYRRTPEVDREFLYFLARKVVESYAVVRDSVNKFTVKFPMEHMDSIDQAVFILAYLEFFFYSTPKEVTINEAVELAKEYGDEGSAKLVNGILEKILVK